MRTKLTLWRILNKYLDEYFKLGMCGYIRKLYNHNLLTSKEVISLEREIKFLYSNRESGYYIGDPGYKEPRKKLIKARIEYYIYMYTLYFFSGMAIIIGIIGIWLDSYTDINLTIMYGVLLFLFIFAITGMVHVNKVTKTIIKLWKIY